jgi:hypothetical protein
MGRLNQPQNSQDNTFPKRRFQSRFTKYAAIRIRHFLGIFPFLGFAL